MAKTGVAKQTNRAKDGGAGKSGATATKRVSIKKGVSARNRDAQHVVEQGGGWVVKSARSGRSVSPSYPVKSQAIDAGRRIAQNLGSDLLIHGRSGQVFQHSPAVSALPEEIIRTAIRSANEKATEKTHASSKQKDSVAKKTKGRSTSANSEPYERTRTYRAGQTISHPIWGAGEVTALIEPRKIDVLFADRIRRLVHSRSDA